MPATTLGSRTALVVIDLQRGLPQVPCVHPFQEVVTNAVRVAEAFRLGGLPVGMRPDCGAG